MFEENFDENGNPTTKKGQELSRVHGWNYWEEYHYTIHGLIKWILKLKKAWKYYSKTEKQKQLESQVELMWIEIMRLQRKVNNLESELFDDNDS
jgi:hypothetical protein